MQIYNRYLLLWVSLFYLSGCSPTDNDAQKLGFSNVTEMKELKRQGFKDKKSFEDYQKVEAEKKKEEVEKKKAIEREEMIVFPVPFLKSKYDNEIATHLLSIQGPKLNCKSTNKSSIRIMPIWVENNCSRDENYFKNKKYLEIIGTNYIRNEYVNRIEYEFNRGRDSCKQPYYSGYAVIYSDANDKINPKASFLSTQKEFNKSYVYPLYKNIEEEFGKEKNDAKNLLENLTKGNISNHGVVNPQVAIRVDREKGDLKFALMSDFLADEKDVMVLSDLSIFNSYLPNLSSSYSCTRVEDMDPNNRVIAEKLFSEIVLQATNRENKKKENEAKKKF